jgi:hypothetical protein
MLIFCSVIFIHFASDEESIITVGHGDENVSYDGWSYSLRPLLVCWLSLRFVTSVSQFSSSLFVDLPWL